MENDLPPQPTIPAQLIARLLTQLGVNSSADQFVADKATVQPAGLRPVDQVQSVLVNANIKAVVPVSLGWRRFDLRCLPVLVLHDNNWFIAASGDNETIDLTNVHGDTKSVDEEELQNTQLVWLKINKTKANQSAPRSGSRARRLVWKELFRDTRWVSKIIIATLIINILAVSTSLFAMQVYDRVVPTMAYSTLTTMVAGMLLIIALDWMLKTLRARILDSMASSVDKRLSQRVFDHLLHVQLDKQPRSLGTLAAQVSGLDSVRQFFSSSVVFALIDLPFALLFIIFIGIIGGAVGWVYMALLPVALLLGIATQWRLRNLLRLQQMRYNERQGVLVDAIRGAESIRAGNASWRFSQLWQGITQSIAGYSIQQKAISNFSFVTTSSLSTLAYVSAIVVGVWQIEAGLLTMGGLIACSILGGRVISPIAQSVQYLTQWQNVSQSLQLVDQVLELETERREDQQLLLPDELPKTIRLDKVRFAYPESPIQQIDIPELSFQSGDRVLLVGPVGCGKSTLLKTIAGLYRPNEGRLRLGDADLWEIDPQVIASQMGYLPQAVHLFKGSLRSNLALSGTASDSRVLRITEQLGIDAIASSHPLGMDQPISEGGEGLSGGQRQLVALARVVINQPRIWLLDEPTASLDNDSETLVWQILEKSIGPEDILIVSTHRPMQAMKYVNRVIVMQQGEVVQDGKPEKIMAHLASRQRNIKAVNQSYPAATKPANQKGGLDVI